MTCWIKTTLININKRYKRFQLWSDSIHQQTWNKHHLKSVCLCGSNSLKSRAQKSPNFRTEFRMNWLQHVLQKLSQCFKYYDNGISIYSVVDTVFPQWIISAYDPPSLSSSAKFAQKRLKLFLCTSCKYVYAFSMWMTIENY